MASRKDRKKERERARRAQAPEKQIQAPDPKPDQMREFPANYWQETPLGTQRENVEAITGQRTHFAGLRQIRKGRI